MVARDHPFFFYFIQYLLYFYLMYNENGNLFFLINFLFWTIDLVAGELIFVLDEKSKKWLQNL